MRVLFIVSAVPRHNSKSMACDLGHKYTEYMFCKMYLSVNACIKHRCLELNGAGPIGIAL
jgi:hypothetical protein